MLSLFHLCSLFCSFLALFDKGNTTYLGTQYMDPSFNAAEHSYTVQRVYMSPDTSCDVAAGWRMEKVGLRIRISFVWQWCAHVLALRKITTPAHFGGFSPQAKSSIKHLPPVTCRLLPQRQPSHINQDDQANEEGRRDVCITIIIILLHCVLLLTLSAAVNTVPGKSRKFPITIHTNVTTLDCPIFGTPTALLCARQKEEKSSPATMGGCCFFRPQVFQHLRLKNIRIAKPERSQRAKST